MPPLLGLNLECVRATSSKGLRKSSKPSRLSLYLPNIQYIVFMPSINNFRSEMDTSTEALLKVSYNSDDFDSGPTSLVFEQITSPLPHQISPLLSSASSVSSIDRPMLPNFQLGPMRQRHLSCIVENWSETDSYSSLPTELTPKSKIFPEDLNSSRAWEAEDLDEYITTLDESNIIDIKSIEKVDCVPFNNGNHCWTPTIYGQRYTKYHSDNMTAISAQIHSANNQTDKLNRSQETLPSCGASVAEYPKIMTESCYGSLNTVNWTSTDYLLNKNTSCEEIDLLNESGKSLSMNNFERTGDNSLDSSICESRTTANSTLDSTGVDFGK